MTNGNLRACPAYEKVAQSILLNNPWLLIQSGIF